MKVKKNENCGGNYAYHTTQFCFHNSDHPSGLCQIGSKFSDTLQTYIMN